MYRVKFLFSKVIDDDEFREKIQKDFIRKREILIYFLNPCYEKWNEEFDDLGIERMEDDPFNDYGGSEYLNFIKQKQRVYVDQVNKMWKSKVELDLSDICDIIGKFKNKDGDEVIMTLELEPIVG